MKPKAQKIAITLQAGPLRKHQPMSTSTTHGNGAVGGDGVGGLEDRHAFPREAALLATEGSRLEGQQSRVRRHLFPFPKMDPTHARQKKGGVCTACARAGERYWQGEAYPLGCRSLLPNEESAVHQGTPPIQRQPAIVDCTHPTVQRPSCERGAQNVVSAATN